MYFGAKLRVLPPWLSVKQLCVSNLKLLKLSCACFLNDRLKVMRLLHRESVRIKADNIGTQHCTVLSSESALGNVPDSFLLLSETCSCQAGLKHPAQALFPSNRGRRHRLPSLTDGYFKECHEGFLLFSPLLTCARTSPVPHSFLSSLTPHSKQVLSLTLQSSFLFILLLRDKVFVP